MKGNKYIVCFLVLQIFFFLPLLGCIRQNMASDDEDVIFKDNSKTSPLKWFNKIPNNLVLIYDGGTHRSIKWDKEHFAPYVADEVDGKDKWIFDGFLFLEIKDGKGYGFASGYEKKAARKTEWEALLHHFFAKDNALDALNAQIEEVRQNKKITEKFEKRKVIISIPEPIKEQTDWGELNGEKLVFSNKENRMAACKWYIDLAEKLFIEYGFNNLDLVGFYWLAEEATHTRDLAKEVAGYLYDKKYDFYWIPYFNSDGYTQWKELGFNVPYYQPNYFFNDEIPISRLQEACYRAKEFKMNMEVEFDERVLKNNKNWGYRLNDYLDIFEKNGVFDSLYVAYYQGGDAFYKLSKSEEKEDKLLYNRLIKLIAKERNKK